MIGRNSKIMFWKCRALESSKSRTPPFMEIVGLLPVNGTQMPVLIQFHRYHERDVVGRICSSFEILT